MTAIRFQEVKPFFTDTEDDDLVPYVFVQEHNSGRHTITVGGGFELNRMKDVADALYRAWKAAELKAEVQEGTP